MATSLSRADVPCMIAGELKEFDPGRYLDSREARRMARFSQIAFAKAAMAIEDAGLRLPTEDVDRVGVAIGNGAGGLSSAADAARPVAAHGVTRISPLFVPMNSPNMAAANVSRSFGLRGWTLSVTTACAAGSQAIGEAPGGHPARGG